jgi:hypothetical protein
MKKKKTGEQGGRSSTKEKVLKYTNIEAITAAGAGGE